MNFRKWLEGMTAGEFLRDAPNKAYEQGVRDAQDDNYNPPFVNSQLSASRKESYIEGWRAMGKRIPEGKDRTWYRDRLRLKQYRKQTGERMIDIRVSDDPKWDDPDYDPEVG